MTNAQGISKAIAHVVAPGWDICNLSWPGGQALVYPGGYEDLVIMTLEFCLFSHEVY